MTILKTQGLQKKRHDDIFRRHRMTFMLKHTKVMHRTNNAIGITGDANVYGVTVTTRLLFLQNIFSTEQLNGVMSQARNELVKGSERIQEPLCTSEIVTNVEQ